MDRTAEQLGLATELMCQSSVYRHFPVACIGTWIKPAIEHEQIHFLFSYEATPLAYWTWALLAPDVEERWINDPEVLLHESEWNEGERLWIMDLVCQRGYLRSVLAYMHRAMFPGHQEAFSLRRYQDGSVKKVRTWQRQEKYTATYYNQSLTKLMPPESFAPSRGDFLASGNFMR